LISGQKIQGVYKGKRKDAIQRGKRTMDVGWERVGKPINIASLSLVCKFDQEV